MAATLSDLIELRPLTPDSYETLHHPERMGNVSNIAYGGCTLAVGVNAACQTLHNQQADFKLYSVLGNYLGPALIDRKVQCHVRVIRNTRTFATRQVEVSQVQDDGEKRVCMILMADFQKQEAATLLVYSTPPAASRHFETKNWRDLPSLQEVRQGLLEEGKVTQKQVKKHKIEYALSHRLLDTRITEASILAQGLAGIAKDLKTSQEHLPVYEKTTTEWIKVKHPLQPQEQMAALAFIADIALSLIPLMNSHLWFESVSAVSSLDFALRIFSGDVDLNKFHLRELGTVTAGEGRTYSEFRLWDEDEHGRPGKMVASMTQQCILRPRAAKI